jgi:hypothetical protein
LRGVFRVWLHRDDRALLDVDLFEHCAEQAQSGLGHAGVPGAERVMDGKHWLNARRGQL